jgi:AraC-like DNA-binding protein
MESFTTRGLPPPLKAAYWNALSSDAFAAMEITPRNISAFDGELRREPIGALTLIDVHSDAVQIRHTRSHVARVTNPSYLLLTPLRGGFELRIDRQAAQRVASGEFCLLDHALPYELQHGDGVRVLCVDIPRATLEGLLPQPALSIGRIMGSDTCLSRLLATLMQGLGSELAPGAQPQFAPTLAQCLLQFVAAAYGDSSDAAPAASTRHQALLACIDARLNDPQLGPDEVARAAGISTRRLRALLAEGGESFSAYLLRRRVERCAQLLRDARWRTHSITEIAFRCGFNNATHFGYAFKRRYGLTPREYRSAGS